MTNPKASIKWLDGAWTAFMPDGTELRSAGISEIVEMVEAAWPPMEKGHTLAWEPSLNSPKFTVRESVR